MSNLQVKPLAHKCFNSDNSRGRRYPLNEELGSLNVDPFTIDIKLLLETKDLRRLQEKAQVFPLPDNPHVRDRCDHTHEVMAISLYLADALGLNMRLCEAIALGHDFGHTPFGHAGESFISELTGRNFRHEIFGAVLLQEIERRGHGLNLSFEVLEGITMHSRGKGLLTEISTAYPEEYNVVLYGDKFGYVFGDLNDLLRYGIDVREKVPALVDYFGKTQRSRVSKCVNALYKETAELGRVSFSQSETAQKFAELRAFMYNGIYPSHDKWKRGLQALADVHYFLANDSRFEGCDPALLLALLTDKEVIYLDNLLIYPIRPSDEQIMNLGIMEILEHVHKEIDIYDPGLNW